MTFLKQLMEDAQPKAQVIADATKNITINAYNSKTVQVARGLTYKGMVNTTAGVMAAKIVVQPAVDTVKSAGSSIWSGIEKLAAQKLTTEQK